MPDREYWEATFTMQGEGDPPDADDVRLAAQEAYEYIGAFGCAIKVEAFTVGDDDTCPQCERMASVDGWIRDRALGINEESE
jgi:hypothetical protein